MLYNEELFIQYRQDEMGKESSTLWGNSKCLEDPRG
jgi:hypothetical protein